MILMMGAGVHAAGEVVSVAAAQPLALQISEQLHSPSLIPSEAVQFEGNGTAVAKADP